MFNLRLVVYLSAIFVVEATIHVCIPLSLSSAKDDPRGDVFKEITKDVKNRFINLTSDSEDPNIVAEHVAVNITHPAIDLYGTLDKVSFYHLHDFNICFLEHIFINSSYYQFDVFNLTFPNIRIDGVYNLTGDLGDIFDVYGDGNFWLEVHNISLAMVNFTITVTDKICFPVTLEIDLREVTNHFDNFMYDDELEEIFNDVISAILPESLKILWVEWKEIFDPLLEDQLNDVLHKNDVASIFKSFLSGQLTRESPYCYDSKDIE